MPDSQAPDKKSARNKSGDCPSPGIEANFLTGPPGADMDFAQAFNCLTHAVRIIDTEYRVRFVNQAFTKLSGIEREEAEGRKCWEVMATPFCHQPGCRLKMIAKSGSDVHCEYNQAAESGGALTCSFSSFPLFSRQGKLIGIMESFRDTSQRKKLQHQVRESEKRLQTLFEHLPIAAWEIDLSRARQRMDRLRSQGARDLKTYLTGNRDDPLITRYPEYSRYIHVNKAAFDLYDLDMNTTSITRFQETLSQRINSSTAEMENHIDILNALFSENTPYEREYELAGTDGGAKTAILKVSVPAGHAKDLSRVFFTMYDITGLRHAEIELKKHQHNLENLVEERTRQLNTEIEQRKQTEITLKEMFKNEKALHRKAKGQLEEKARFTAMLAHELKTPITPVISASDYLVNTLTDEPLVSFARQINRGVLRLLARIDELLDINRNELGMLRLKKQKFNIEGLLRECHSVFLPIAGERNLSLNLNVPRNLHHVHADGERIRQVIFNLLDNAVRYTPAGGAVIINARDEPDKVQIEISNTGSSLHQTHARELFLPYWKRSDGSELKEGSHGLGLSICKMLIGLHGENLWVETRPEIGTVFGFTLQNSSAKKPAGGRS